MKNILIIIGSLRKTSFNRQLAGEIESILAEKASVTYLEYSDLPFMNQDIEFPVPETVARIRAAAQEADGIWIVSPEYNYNIPGVLKNLLDWLSRPVDPRDRKSGSAVKGKAVTVSSVAGMSAGAGMRKILAGLLEVMSMRLVGGEGSGVVLDMEAFISDKLSLSEKNRAVLQKQAEELLASI